MIGSTQPTYFNNEKFIFNNAVKTSQLFDELSM